MRKNDLSSLLTAIMCEEVQTDEQTARELAAAMARGLTKLYGGRDLYIPTMRNNFERNESIRRDFNGRNIRELQETWDVSRSTIYRQCRGRK